MLIFVVIHEGKQIMEGEKERKKNRLGTEAMISLPFIPFHFHFYLLSFLGQALVSFTTWSYHQLRRRPLNYDRR